MIKWQLPSLIFSSFFDAKIKFLDISVSICVSHILVKCEFVIMEYQLRIEVQFQVTREEKMCERFS